MSGSRRLAGKAAVVAGGDHGVGRAVAIAYAREGADVLIAYLDDHADAQETATWVEQAGRRAVLVPGDLASAAHCRSVIDTAVVEFGRVDILVSDAAWHRTRRDPKDASGRERDRMTVADLGAFAHLARAALPHMRPGCPINSSRPSSGGATP